MMGSRSAPARLLVAPLFIHPLALALALAVLAGGCEPLTQIVLVVDTDMNVPTDLDQIAIRIEGTSSGTKDFALPAIGFPRTLGLVSSGDTSTAGVTVTVAASLQGGPVLTAKVHTGFVNGASRMLRMVLSTACLPVSCAVSETCEEGACRPIDRSGSSLPGWSGAAPARPPSPPPVDIVGQSVWASGWHSAATQGSTLYAWGENSEGQLGTGNMMNAKTRRPVMNVQAPLSVGLGQKYSCICDGTHQAYCWGLNDSGQLGIGTTTSQVVATAVPGLMDCVQIAGADFHTCAIREGGGVSCWGRNSFGQLGQPVGPPVLAPALVPGLTDVVQVGGGDGYSCALHGNKTVSCWGNNNTGQLGDGTMVTRAAPAPVTGLGDVVEIAVGRGHACGRQSSGNVWCWGTNGRGQLGNGTQTNSALPVAVMGLTDAAQVVAGHLHTCARTSGSSTVSCWGANNAGQLGLGISPALNTVPAVVPGLYQVVSLAAGSEHNCARHGNGSDLSCWGDNLVNQLGDGSTSTRRTPVSVAGFSGL